LIIAATCAERIGAITAKQALVGPIAAEETIIIGAALEPLIIGFAGSQRVIARFTQNQITAGSPTTGRSEIITRAADDGVCATATRQRVIAITTKQEIATFITA
jgi:hypothetical protein